MSKRKVIHAVLHGNINVPGISTNVDKTLRPVTEQGGVLKSLEMEIGDGTLDCTFTGRTGQVVHVGVPLTNVQSFVFDPHANAPKIVSEKK